MTDPASPGNDNPFTSREQTAVVPPPLPVSAQQIPGTTVEHRFSFTGSGGDYFGIWIVNAILNILTLGIYSPWAKVRREQYFHRNTLLDGAGFDYHASPFGILKGRIIAVAVFIIYTALSQLNPLLGLAFLVVTLPFWPWVIVRSIAFRAKNTSWRGVRFNFSGTYGKCAKIYVGYIAATIAGLFIISAISFGIVGGLEGLNEIRQGLNSASQGHYPEETAIPDETEPAYEAEPEDEYEPADEADEDTEDSATLNLTPRSAFGAFDSEPISLNAWIGLATITFIFWTIALFILIEPLFKRSLNLFQINHLSFGTTPLTCHFSVKAAYGTWFRGMLPILTSLVIMSAIGTIAFVLWAIIAASNTDVAKVISVVIGAILGGLAYTALYFGAYIAVYYLRALRNNLTWNNAELGGMRFVSDMKFGGLCGIVLLNLFLTGLTLGLYWPWALVALTRYRAEHTAVLANGNINDFAADNLAQQNALGEEIGEFFDFDISL